MSFVTTEEFQREGREVDSEMTALQEAVSRTTADAQKLGAAKVPFPDGPWWQRWQGFYGSWTQYYQEQVRPTPVLPLHDDGDIKQWSADLGTWKAEFAKGQLQNAAKQLGGPLTDTLHASSSAVPGWFKVGGVLVALGVGGYFLSSVGNVKRAFT